MSYHQHPQALVESNSIGENTTIGAFCHVLAGAVIGKDCCLCDQTIVEDDVIIGDRVTVECGVQLWDGIRIEDDVFIGPNATFAIDRFPRGGRRRKETPITTVRFGASIGANATILPGLTVGQQAMVGAGAVVTNSVPPYAIVVGNPARIVRYLSSQTRATQTQPDIPRVSVVTSCCVEGVTLSRKPTIRDMRGNLSARELDGGIPFIAKRYFIITDVPSKEVRGEHAHRRCKQLLICLKGSVQVVADDGTNRQEFILDSPELALYLPPMVWGIQYRYTQETVLMVLASELYDPSDYIRDYDEFLLEKRST